MLEKQVTNSILGFKDDMEGSTFWLRPSLIDSVFKGITSSIGNMVSTYYGAGNEVQYQRMESFLDLPAGWHYGEGHAPSNNTLLCALRIYEEINIGDLKIETFPGVWGEIEIDIHQRGKCGEVIIDANNDISITIEEDGDEIYSQENMTLTEVIKTLSEHFKGDLKWNSSELSAERTIVTSIEDSKAFVLQTPPMGAEYQLFPVLAY